MKKEKEEKEKEEKEKEEKEKEKEKEEKAVFSLKHCPCGACSLGPEF